MSDNDLYALAEVLRTSGIVANRADLLKRGASIDQLIKAGAYAALRSAGTPKKAARVICARLK